MDDDSINTPDTLADEVKRLRRQVTRLQQFRHTAKPRPDGMGKDLSEEQARLTAIFDHAPLAMLLLDREWCVQYANRAAQKLIHELDEPVQGRRCGVVLRCLRSMDVEKGCGYGPECENCKVRTTAMDTLQTGKAHYQVRADLNIQSDPPRTSHLLISSIPLQENGDLVLVCLEDITARTTALQNLIDQRDQARMYLDVANVVFVALDRNAKVVLLNRKGCELLGCKQEEIVGTHWFETCIPEHCREEVLTGFEMLIGGQVGPIEYFENPILAADGTERIMAWHNTLLYDAEGDIIGTLSSGIDITEQKVAEQDLRLALLRQQEAVKAGNVGLWDWDLRTNKVRYSPEWKSQIGYEEHEIGDSFHEWQSRVHPEDLPQALERVNTLVSDARQNYCLEFRFRHKNGSYRYILAQASVLVDEKGQPFRVLGSHVDITEQKEAQEALRISEERMSSAFNYAAIGMAFVAPNGRWLKVNSAVLDLLGYTEEELLAKTFQDITYPDDLQTDLNYVRHMLAGEIATYQMEKRYFHKSGRTVWALLSVSLVRDHEGRPLHFISQIQDISERKQAQQRRQQHRLAMDHASRLSTIGQMASELAHELNQPLSTITTYIDTCIRLLNSTEADYDQIHDIIDKVGQQAENAAAITARMRTFARKREPKMERCNIDDLVRDAIALCSPEARRVGIEIEANLDSQEKIAYADSLQLEQVVVNLIRNAMEATEQSDAGRHKIKITTTCENGMILVSVSDTGTGIPEQVAEKMYEPFFTTKPQGLGVGLSICKSIMEAHRGRLEMIPQNEGGTIFRFSIPGMRQET